ncbi:unnamed protein product [Amoebophrya sp. A25]|nr:unnamed protein product [Amoebophrya sp. A25]|eukprot:GSA25T00009568001.1
MARRYASAQEAFNSFVAPLCILLGLFFLWFQLLRQSRKQSSKHGQVSQPQWSLERFLDYLFGDAETGAIKPVPQVKGNGYLKARKNKGKNKNQGANKRGGNGTSANDDMNGKSIKGENSIKDKNSIKDDDEEHEVETSPSTCTSGAMLEENSASATLVEHAEQRESSSTSTISHHEPIAKGKKNKNKRARGGQAQALRQAGEGEMTAPVEVQPLLSEPVEVQQDEVKPTSTASSTSATILEDEDLISAKKAKKKKRALEKKAAEAAEATAAQATMEKRAAEEQKKASPSPSTEESTSGSDLVQQYETMITSHINSGTGATRGVRTSSSPGVPTEQAHQHPAEFQDVTVQQAQRISWADDLEEDLAAEAEESGLGITEDGLSFFFLARSAPPQAFAGTTFSWEPKFRASMEPLPSWVRHYAKHGATSVKRRTAGASTRKVAAA